MEEVSFKVVALKDENSFQDINQDLKQLEKPRAAEIALDIDAAKTRLRELQKLQKEALATGDFNFARKFGAEIELAKKQVTTLNRALTNFQRTGNENISVLGKMFGNVESKMKQTFNGISERMDATYIKLAEVGKNTSGIELLKNKLIELEKKFKDGKISIKEYTEGIKKLGDETTKISNSLEHGDWIIGKFSSKLSWLGINFWSMLTGAWVALGAQMMNLADKYEQASISFEVMLGSAEKAKTLLEEISLLAQESPYDSMKLRDTSKLLLAMGVSLNNVIPTMKALGDVASGTGVDIERLAVNYGQVMTLGKLQWDELKEFLQAGVPMLEVLAQKFGVSTDKIREMAGAWQLTAQDMQDAFEMMTSEGGKFNDMMAKQSETFSWQMAALGDSWATFMEKLGSYILPFAKQVVDGLSIVVWYFDDFIAAIQISGIALVYAFQTMWNNIKNILNWAWMIFSTAGAYFQEVMRFTGQNIWIAVENIGIAFQNLPSMIQDALNSALDVINGFVNSAGDALNWMANFFGFEWKLVGTANMKMSFAGPKKAYKDFVAFGWKLMMEDLQNIQNNYEWKRSAIESWQSALKGAAKESITDIYSNLVQNEWKTVRDKFDKIWNNGDPKSWKNNGKWGGWGGGGKSKADQEEKKRLEEIKKKEEELAKIRTNAYKEANKRVEKFSEVIKNSNKKLEEQKKKLEEIKKSAEEVIKDLDEKLVDNQASFEEKIAKRYNDIIKDLKDELKDIGINGLSDEDMVQSVMEGRFSGGEFDKWKQELEIIQKKVDKEKLELAIKNENLTETEKITAEYEKQDALLKNSLELQKAIKEGRYITNADGGLDFLDENGNILKALDRDQEKEFASEVKKIQDIANEELKIFQEKNEKIGELLKEFEEEKRVLNEEYFEKDKEMRLEQHRMMEEFFAEEISKMEELAYLAGNFGKNFTTGNLFTKKDENIPENSTNTGSASVSSNKSVVESGQKSENIFKNEEKILDDRSQKNAEILQKFHDIVAKIEGGITSTTDNEINRRMSLYAQEEARLNTLIAKRIQAGYAIASVPREFQNVNNTTNNSATINVNATSGGSIDANQLANTIMRKVQNYQKWIK